MRLFFILRTREEGDDDKDDGGGESNDSSSSSATSLHGENLISNAAQWLVLRGIRFFAPPREISTALRFLARHPSARGGSRALNARRTRCVSTQVDRKVEPPPERPSLYSAFIRRQCTMLGSFSL